jgi:hypothetical protein
MNQKGRIAEIAEEHGTDVPKLLRKFYMKYQSRQAVADALAVSPSSVRERVMTCHMQEVTFLIPVRTLHEPDDFVWEQKTLMFLACEGIRELEKSGNREALNEIQRLLTKVLARV